MWCQVSLCVSVVESCEGGLVRTVMERWGAGVVNWVGGLVRVVVGLVGGLVGRGWLVDGWVGCWVWSRAGMVGSWRGVVGYRGR